MKHGRHTSRVSRPTGNAAARRRLRHEAALFARRTVLAGLVGALFAPAYALDPSALPTDGRVFNGQGAIGWNGNAMTVVQNSQRLGIDWQSFNIGAEASVHFQQPNAQSVALNRVLSGEASQIFGRLSANGQVFLVNPSGILFAPGARVDVGGLVASTLSISDEDFAAGRDRFIGSGTPGSVINRGELRAGEGGYIALLAPEVRNEGFVSARLGTVALAAGNRVTLDMGSDGLLNVAVTEAALDAQAANRQLIEAEGGRVIMTARAAGDLARQVINQEGIVRATSVAERNGAIVLDGGAAGVVAVSGTLDASGRRAGETGGTVKVLGEKVGLFDGARIDVSGDAGGGTALVGGNLRGEGPEPNARFAYVAQNASIAADAIRTGDGGRVIVWADDTTRFSGAISANGGAVSGNGGFVETSGKRFLEAIGRVTARAHNGAAGQWLLDPTNITVSHGASGGALGGVFQPGGDTATITDGTINATLNNGTSLSIVTSSAGANQGDIIVNGDAVIQKTAGGDAEFALLADRSVIILNGARIGSTAGRLHLYLSSEGTGSAPTISINNATINTNGGHFYAGHWDPVARNFSSANGEIFMNDTSVATGSGNASLAARYGGNQNGTTVDVLNSLIQSTGGNVRIYGDSMNATPPAGGFRNGVRLDNVLLQTAGSGEISVTGYAASSPGARGRGVSMYRDTLLQSAGWTVTVNGIGSALEEGIYLDHSHVRSTGSGIFLNGTGYGGIKLVNASSLGAFMNIDLIGTGVLNGDGVSLDLSSVRSSQGDISIQGYGCQVGGCDPTANFGVGVNLWNTQVQADVGFVTLYGQVKSVDCSVCIGGINSLVSGGKAAGPAVQIFAGRPNDNGFSAVNIASGIGGILAPNGGDIVFGSTNGFGDGQLTRMYVDGPVQGRVKVDGASDPDGLWLYLNDAAGNRIDHLEGSAAVLDVKNGTDTVLGSLTVANGLSVTAIGNVTQDGALQADTLHVRTTAPGKSVTLTHNGNQINGANIDGAGGGAAQLTVTGSMAAVVTGFTDAELRSLNGSLYTGGHDITGTLRLYAPNGTVGTSFAPVNVVNAASLYAQAGDDDNGVSVNVSGTIGDNSLRVVAPPPPGACLLNGAAVACVAAPQPNPGNPPGSAAPERTGLAQAVADAARAHLRSEGLNGAPLATVAAALPTSYPTEQAELLVRNQADPRVKPPYGFINRGMRLPDGL